ncbi:sterol desaturase family protein [Desulfococcus multivorans]|uniref:Fatty acid hydroxylase n=2 Tax=Desulfococcus multivorans TaxID=897 RepID=S7TPK7_DESML|nr:sterol desaturase family protein [Desulfococcus multivorans]AOY57773.1 sterol desaturase-related protein [Desulfococcus multivorans]AQV00159.1 fatty acid hydroxylase [Desulfococcus multivorans]EPR38856.1 fatty acid hydroxylase [Desulfococcus multivorans DSM 2059]SKA28057.1 Sterol desaturase/sphingolipid hydroxylase, fatty acid hydroxylase superfamily [Desulfococcus multivorans DSM 2059]
MGTDTIIRLSAFLCVFAILSTAEFFTPRRRLTTSRSRRWFANLTIVALNPLSVALVYPVLPIEVALLASEQGWGLLNQWALPYGLEVLMGVAALDFAVYAQHVLHHAIPMLWRLHLIHHADLDFDLTTGLRFHPIEIIVSMAVKLSIVVALGAPPLAVLIFEVALNATSMFNHSNIRIPGKVDWVLRLIVVTPDMHRVHHSVIIRETNSNYGFNLPWWDRLLGTYKAQPAKGHTDMVIGLSQFRDPKRLTLPRLLILPFVGDPGRVPINRH